MTNYLREHLPGATYFFAVNLADRHSALLTDRIQALRATVRYAQQRHPFVIKCNEDSSRTPARRLVSSDGDADFPLRWRLIKTRLRARSHTANTAVPAASPKVSEASGSVAIGNT